MKRGLGGLAIAFFCFIGLLGVGAASILISMPDAKSLRGCLTTELYHVYLCKTAPGYTPFEQISTHIVDAVIMSEDGSFYSHQGVDLVEMKESLKKDLSELRFARGASTITQQMVKNVFLSKNKSIVRKAEEIYLALQVEKMFNKNQILTFYLNVVEFGPNIYGVKAACRHYFNKLPSEVSPEQAAFLAFLLPNPKKYSRSFDKRQLTPFAKRTVKTILHRMSKSHRLSDTEFEVAVSHVGSNLWRGGFSTAATGEADLVESPTGVVDSPQVPQAPSYDGLDESNQDNDEFKFDFNADESN